MNNVECIRLLPCLEIQRGCRIEVPDSQTLGSRPAKDIKYLQAAFERGRLIGYLPFFRGLEAEGKLGAVASVKDRLSNEKGTLVPYFMRIFAGSGDREKARIREMKIYDYWREQGWPDLCRPVGDDDFKCD